MPSKRREPDVRTLLVAVAVGLFVGVGAVFGWAHETPAALGFFTFCSVLIGAQVRR